MDVFRADLLKGKTTIITGGGTGLGRSIALRLASLGARVALLGRREGPLGEAVQAIREAGGEALGVAVSTTYPSTWTPMSSFARSPLA